MGDLQLGQVRRALWQFGQTLAIIMTCVLQWGQMALEPTILTSDFTPADGSVSVVSSRIFDSRSKRSCKGSACSG